MSTSIQKAENRAKSAREKSKQVEHGIVRKAVIGVGASALALADNKGLPLSVGGVPVKLGLSVLLTLGEAMTRGTSRRLLGAAADCCLAVYSYKSVKSGAFIAGEGEDEV